MNEYYEFSSNLVTRVAGITQAMLRNQQPLSVV